MDFWKVDNVNETRIYDPIKTILGNCDIDDSLFWERMKYLEENEVIYNKLIKNGNTFHILKKDREIVSSANGLAAVINFSNNSVSTTQDLQDSLSLISNSTDALDKLIDATGFNLSQKSTTEKILQTAANAKILKMRF